MNDELVTVATTFDIVEAEFLRNRLEEEGIRVFLADENLIGVHGLLANAVGGIKIKVIAEDAGDARAIVEEFRAANAEVSKISDEDTGWGECPMCESKNLKPYRDAFGWKGILVFFGIPLVKPQRTLACRNCGNQWANP